MSQRRSSQKLPPQNWRGDEDIISMETRILPKNAIPSSSQRFPQVQIPLRNASQQSSATPPIPARPVLSSLKRPQSSSSAMDPTPSKRHRIDLIVPKDEPDESAMIPTPRQEHNSGENATPSVAENGAPSETASTEPTKSSYVQ